jgi:hypothetical protein
MQLTHNPKDFYHKIYYESSAEFEEVRALCLTENHWLRNNWLPKNMKVEDYHGVSVIYYKENNEPAGFAGMFNPGRYSNHVAQHCHRMYTFPRFRLNSYEGLLLGWKLFEEHVINPLNELHPFDLYFIAMQNRYTKTTKGYWKAFSSAGIAIMPEWKIGEGYIHTCTANVQKCYQNFMYTEVVPGSFDRWDKNIIGQEVWNGLEQGI